jgi:PAS domain S-box-containing protein
MGKNSDILYGEGSTPADSQDFYRNLEGLSPASLHRRKDGSEFPVSLSISAIRDESGKETARIGVARDISEQILAEDKIRSINQKLKRTNRIMS